MADLSLSFSPTKNEEKLCRYAYTSWCPTCDKESPRRRTRSETSEPCRRKGKEMKTFTPKKYNRCQEYENMELEYDAKDLRFDCCRIRSNLCELPTTYIANNCQLYTNMSNLSKMTSGISDYLEKPQKTYENSFKVDYNNTGQNFAMNDKYGKNGIKPDDYFRTAFENQMSSKLDVLKSNFTLTGLRHNYGDSRKAQARHLFEVPKQEALKTPQKKPPGTGSSIYLNTTHICNSYSPLRVDKYHLAARQKYLLQTLPTDDNALTGRNVLKSRATKSVVMKPNPNPSILDLKLKEIQDNCDLCYDTCTFFDKRDYDTTNLQQRYFKEVDILRGNLKEISKSKLQGYVKKEAGSKKEIIEISADIECEPVEIVKDYSNFNKSLGNNLNLNSSFKADVWEKGDISCYEKVEKAQEEKIAKREKIKSESKPQKISVKAKTKLSSIKLRHITASKIPNNVSSDSEFSDSDDGSEVEEEACNVTESECSVENSKTSIKEKDVIKNPSQIGAGDSNSEWPLRESLFPHIPPYINFNMHDAEVPFNVPNGRRYLKWKLSTITPIVVRQTLTNTGFRLVRSEFSRESNEWLGTWGKHMKSPMFKTLKDIHKINHFPGTFQIGRKDRLWRNLQKLMCRFGQKEFGFIPQSFVLPQDLKLLKQCWENKNGSGGEIFIIKPPASARGVGIKVINKWSQLPKKSSVVVQRYISNPYLINGSKFDLRLYVLVTSFNPLRIYLYPDGLARFASAKYSEDAKDLKDRYMHLTNYSINKFSSQYTANEDANACQGHKWTLSKLWEYMEKNGVDTKALWKNLEGLVIKTIICGESPITQLSKENLTSRYNCYELFGVDVLLDERLKPWLLEVNISPSLHSASPLDAYVKGPLVKALFDMAQFHLPPKVGRMEKMPSCYEPKIYTTALLKREKSKHVYFSQLENRQDYLKEIIENLTGDDVRHLTQAEDELTVKGSFDRIFPTSQTHRYLEFMETRYYNRLFDAWECKYEKNRKPGIKILQSLCAKKIHLKVGSHDNSTKNSLTMIPVELTLVPSMDGVTRPCDIDNLTNLTTNPFT